MRPLINGRWFRYPEATETSEARCSRWAQGRCSMASSKGGKTLISDAPLSESSASTKSRALDIFGEMRESTPELRAAYPCAFERLPETTVCSMEFYHAWATFLTE